MKRIETLLGSIGDSSVPLIDTLEDLRYSFFSLFISEKIRSLKYIFKIPNRYFQHDFP